MSDVKVKRKFLPRKPRAINAAEVERLLRAAANAAADLPEPSPDLVARAVARAQAKSAPHAARTPSAAVCPLPRIALGAVAFAGIVVLAAAVAMPPFLRPSASPRAAAGRVAISTAHGESSPLAPPDHAAADVTAPPVVRPAVHDAMRRRLVARRHRRSPRMESASRRVVRTSVAPKTAATVEISREISRVALSGTQSANTPKRMLGITRTTSAAPRPFWHDEQVERDDYVVSAPAIIAEGTDQGVTSVRPALVQVAFSTTRPIADNASYLAKPGNP